MNLTLNKLIANVIWRVLLQIYIHIYIEREREKERQRDREKKFIVLISSLGGLIEDQMLQHC